MLFTQAPFDTPITDDSGNLLKDGDVIAELHTTESIKAFAERIIVRARKLNVEVIVHRSFHGSKKEGKPGQQHYIDLRCAEYKAPPSTVLDLVLSPYK